MESQSEHSDESSVKNPRGIQNISDFTALELLEAVEADATFLNTNNLFNRYTSESFDRSLLLNLAIDKATVTIDDSRADQNVVLYWTDDESKAIATIASFILVSGKVKVGKTNALVWIVSALLGKVGLPYTAKLSNNDEALWIDTEQSRGHISSVGTTVAKQFELDSSFHPRLKFLSLRSYSPRARWHLIEHAIKINNRIRIVVIDNLADLVLSVLDEREANELFSTLTRLIEANSLLVIGVIHRNKTNAHSKGHLGTMAEQRAETVLDVDRKGNVVFVEAKLTRNAPVPTIAYTFENGHFNFQDETEKVKPIVKKNFSRVPLSDHTQVLLEVFKNQSVLTPAEFKEALKQIYSLKVMPIGLELLKKLQAFYVQQNLVVKENGKLRMR